MRATAGPLRQIARSDRTGSHGLVVCLLYRGATALFDALASNTTVTHLSLETCGHFDNNLEATAALAAALRKNSTLRSLDLTHTPLSHEAGLQILEAIGSRSSAPARPAVAEDEQATTTSGGGVVGLTLRLAENVDFGGLSDGGIDERMSEALYQAAMALARLDVYACKIGETGAADEQTSPPRGRLQPRRALGAKSMRTAAEKPAGCSSGACTATSIVVRAAFFCLLMS